MLFYIQRWYIQLLTQSHAGYDAEEVNADSLVSHNKPSTVWFEVSHREIRQNNLCNNLGARNLWDDNKNFGIRIAVANKLALMGLNHVFKIY